MENWMVSRDALQQDLQFWLKSIAKSLAKQGIPASLVTNNCPFNMALLFAKTSYMQPAAETVKANNLKPYEYFEYLLREIPKHMDDTNRAFPDALVPW